MRPVTQSPRRVLLVSATIGEGHNATARALEEAARRLWPGCEVRWLDTLQVMGRGVGPLFKWIYVFNVEKTPWLYNLFYAALWRYRWFADASRRCIGAWCGRRLRPLIRRAEPDLVISTYPLGTAGLDWLRRHGELEIPAAAVVSDFSPHPFWVYSEIDMHYVMSAASLRELHRAQPDAVGAVCVPPVVSAFQPGDKRVARGAFGFPEDSFLVLISCGSLGFGSIERAVDAALRVAGVERVAVVCGQNEQLRARLADRGAVDDRLVPLGWVREMSSLTAAADVVVTNAGGATALEALACGRTVAMFEPIAGHGRANAKLMADASLADLCSTQDALSGMLRKLAAEPEQLHAREQRALRHAQAGDFVEQVERLMRVARHTGSRSLRSQDAFFVHATTPAVSQQTGAALLLEDVPTGMTEEGWYAHLSRLVAQRAPGLPMLHRRLVRRRTRKPLWLPVQHVDPDEHVGCRTLHGVETQEWERHFREFFAAPVRTDRPPWEVLLLRDVQADRTALLAKMHHALGDGLAVTSTLVHLLRDASGNEPTGFPTRPGARGNVLNWKGRSQRLGAIARGLASLAGAGTAPPSGLEGPSTADRRYGWAQLSSAEVRASARAHDVGTSVLLLAVVAEALHRVLIERDGAECRERLRVMVPKTTRNAREGSGGRAAGNHTVTVAIDLPVGPMAPARRVQKIAVRLGESENRGQPAAAGMVLAALGVLPSWLHAWVVRRIYQRRFFNAVISALPGPRRPPRLRGALIAGVLPVLSLADGVGIAVGAISWGDMAGIAVTTDARLGTVAEDTAGHVRDAFDELRAPSEPGETA